MPTPISGSPRQYGYGYSKPKSQGSKAPKPTPPVKTARKAKTRKHTNDATYSKPSGGHEFQNLPTAVKINPKTGEVTV